MNIAGVQKRYSFAFLMGSITQTANPSPPSLKVSLTHGKIWSGVKYVFYFKYIKRNKQKQKYVLNIIYYIKTKILIKNNLKHAQKSAQKLEKIVQKVEDKKKPVL